MYTGDMPTLQKLKTMKGPDGSPLKIIKTIAAGDYQTFGAYLLQDRSSVPKTRFYRGAVDVTKTILEKWLTSSTTTRTYQHLIECLRLSKMDTLADLIATCAKSVIHCTLADLRPSSIELSPEATSGEHQGMPCNTVSISAYMDQGTLFCICKAVKLVG